MQRTAAGDRSQAIAIAVYLFVRLPKRYTSLSISYAQKAQFSNL